MNELVEQAHQALTVFGTNAQSLHDLITLILNREK